MALDRFCLSSGKLFEAIPRTTVNTMTSDQTGDKKSNDKIDPIDPKAMDRREGYFKGQGGEELFFQTWTSPASRATLVITHGISEHSESYNKTAEHLLALGWNICAWDLRGHGRSAGKRGFVEDFALYARDLEIFLRFLKESGRLQQPYALVGHSMGGLITLRHIIDQGPKLEAQGVALSSPLLGVSLEVPILKDLAARVLNKIMPSITLHNEIRYEDLTRDPEFLKGYSSDVLRHDKISPALYFGMFQNMDYVKARARDLHVPLLIQAAGKEKVVSLPAIREFFPMVGSAHKKLLVYEDSYHEIYNDLDREVVFKDLHQFLAAALGIGS